MKIQIYYSSTDHTFTVYPQDTPKDKMILEIDAVLIKEIYGTDWNDCMKQYHEFMGWEPYVPMEEG